MKYTRQKIFSSIFLSLVAIMFLFSCAKRDITTLIEEIKPAVVTIITFGLKERTGPWVENYWWMDTLSQGSGFFINSNGHVVTNYHVLKDADSAIIKTVDNKIYSGNLKCLFESFESMTDNEMKTEIKQELQQIYNSMTKTNQSIEMIDWD